MALHIDLYHEIRAQQLARKRDPLKITMLAMIVLAIGLIAYYGFRLQQVSRLRGKSAQLENEWKLMADKQDKAKAREAELNAQIKLAETLVQRIEGRFFWAPVLGQILQTVPNDVQIVKFEGDSTGDQSKRCNIVLHGISVGDEPRTVAETLRTTLATNYSRQFPKAIAVFKALEDSIETVQASGKKRASANFAISLELPRPEATGTAQAGARTTSASLPVHEKRK